MTGNGVHITSFEPTKPIQCPHCEGGIDIEKTIDKVLASKATIVTVTHNCKRKNKFVIDDLGRLSLI